jgi:CRISPR-associated endoribonuclease Cas6
MEYHKDIQGLIYALLRDSEYDVHEKRGFKFFTFSNIFPFYDLKRNDKRNLLISSPQDNFISYLKEQLEYLPDIRIGSMSFKLEYCRKLILHVSDNPSLITATPIICNIHRYRFEQAGVLHLVNDHAAAYWRSKYPVDLFLKQVEANFMKKYNAYLGLGVSTAADVDIESNEPVPLFYRSRFLKQVAIPLSMGQDRYRHVAIGTNWLFGITDPKLARFALDVGLGELNSLGFGFMNLLGDTN